MKEHKHGLLRLGVTRILCPDIQLQAVLGRGVVVLGGKVLPDTQAGRLRKVWEGAHGWLVGEAVAVQKSMVTSASPCVWKHLR